MFGVRLFTSKSCCAMGSLLLQSFPAALMLNLALALCGEAWTIWAVWWLAMAFSTKSKRRECGTTD
jgi:hypothetical protein